MGLALAPIMPGWTTTGFGYRKTIGRSQMRDDSRKSDRLKAEARRKKEKGIREQLRLYHRLRPQGGGPGASVITGSQIRADVSNIRSGATAREVLG